MKQFYKKIILLSFPFFSITQADTDACTVDGVAPYFSVRSQSVYLPRITGGWNNFTHQFETDSFSATFAITPGYSKTFRHEGIAECLFGSSLQNNCECPQINISGSRVLNPDQTSARGSCDWLADYFGLANDFKGTIQFKPKISNVFIDFALHVGLDEWIEGLWFSAWAPFVHTKWDLDFCESNNGATTGYSDDYWAGTAIPGDSVLKNALDFFQKMKTISLPEGVTFEPLRSCKWGECACDFDTYVKANGIADIRFALGWDFYKKENRHIGLGIIAAAPVGSRPRACNLFEPVIGNGKHWELGGVWTSHSTFWASEDGRSHLGFHLDANITHLFKAKQQRCFDLCGKPMSRYMLAQKMGTPVNQLWAAPNEGNRTDAEQPKAQFKDAYAPVANLTCADVKVSVGVQVDLVAQFNITRGGFSWDIGYNFWNRSCEKIRIDCSCPSRLAQEPDTWALKGDASTYGFGATNAPTTSLQGVPVALSATQSIATIFSGTNICAQGTSAESPIDNRRRNPAIDNPQWGMLATLGAQEVAENNDILVFSADQQVSGFKQVFTSKEPVFFNQCDLDLDGARTKGRSHSVFTHLSYAFNPDGESSGYIGVGAQGEFDSRRKNSCKTDCPTECPSICDLVSCTANSVEACEIVTTNNCTKSTTECDPCRKCLRCAVSQWQVWVKGGFTFG